MKIKNKLGYALSGIVGGCLGDYVADLYKPMGAYRGHPYYRYPVFAQYPILADAWKPLCIVTFFIIGLAAFYGIKRLMKK